MPIPPLFRRLSAAKTIWIAFTAFVQIPFAALPGAPATVKETSTNTKYTFPTSLFLLVVSIISATITAYGKKHQHQRLVTLETLIILALLSPLILWAIDVVDERGVILQIDLRTIFATYFFPALETYCWTEYTALLLLSCGLIYSLWSSKNDPQPQAHP